MSDFKSEAIEVYRESLRSKIPNLSSQDEEIIVAAFSTGFTIGESVARSEESKKIALQLLGM